MIVGRAAPKKRNVVKVTYTYSLMWISYHMYKNTMYTFLLHVQNKTFITATFSLPMDHIYIKAPN